MDTELRLPPQDLLAEQSVIACEMLDGAMIDVVREIIDADDFYAGVHKRVQQVILKMRDNSQAVDIITLAEELIKTGLLEEVGGIPYLHEMGDAIPPRAFENAPRHAHAVAECSRRRKLIAAAKELEAKAWSGESGSEDILDAFTRKANSLSESIAKRSERSKSLQEHAIEVVESMSRGVEPTMFVGIGPVDDMIGGVARGEMVVIGGLTSMGKTMTTMQWLHEASRKGVPTMIISNEMTGVNLASRMMSGMTLMPHDMWKSNTAKLAEDVFKFYEHNAPIIVAEHCGTIAEVERAITKGVREHDVAIVALDYCQLVRGEGQTQEQRVGNVSRRFKQAVMRNKVVGILLSQLNRQAAKESRVPVLSDFRDSGSIEQDADIVLFPYWPAKVDPNEKNKYRYLFFHAKNRPRGVKVATIEMRVDPERQWLEASTADEWEQAF